MCVPRINLVMEKKGGRKIMPSIFKIKISCLVSVQWCLRMLNPTPSPVVDPTKALP